MSETLTYQPDSIAETTAETLTPEEQDSLSVGEQIVQQQDQLLAGKYKDAEALEKAYVELEKKLGDSAQAESKPAVESESEPVAESEPESEPESEEQISEPDTELLDELWDQVVDKKVSQETISKIKKMDPEQIAKMHLDYRAQNQSRTLNASEVEQLKGVVGGPENYDNMMEWAKTGLNKGEIEMYDKVMAKADPLGCYFAIQALAYRYQDASGVDGQLIAGKAPSPQTQDKFRSQQELVAAMSDSRYDNDPAYRSDIQEKLARSTNLSF